jgi:hypothetical protein
LAPRGRFVRPRRGRHREVVKVLHASLRRASGAKEWMTRKERERAKAPFSSREAVALGREAVARPRVALPLDARPCAWPLAGVTLRSSAPVSGAAEDAEQAALDHAVLQGVGPEVGRS